jgi:NTP pyrophosphatase (non-canonical NTP hydrolase)
MLTRKQEEALGTFNGYQKAAIRTAAGMSSSLEGGAFQNIKAEGLAITALGIAGEAGEVADYIKKVLGHGHPLDIDKLRNELGDVLWYVAVMAHHLNLDFEDVARQNIAKLKKRYPEGFSTEKSINRELPRCTRCNGVVDERGPDICVCLEGPSLR